MSILAIFFLTLLQIIKSSGFEKSHGIYDDKICQSQLDLFTFALSNREFWAIELFDSWAKFQSGYLRGNTQNIRNFDQCIGFSHKTQSSGIIQGQFCIVLLQASPNSTLEKSEGFDLKEL